MRRPVRFLALVLAVVPTMARSDPGEVPPSVRFVDRHTLSWNGAPGGHRYNVFKAIRASSGPFEYTHDCLALDLSQTTLVDALPVPRERLAYYLVGAEDENGVQGSLGSGPGGVPRPPAAPCTDIDGDALSDGLDNCPSWPNPGQEDFDSDARGDPCDDDDDDDSLSDIDEFARGTDPLDSDTDEDGLSDGSEVARGTDPRSGDTDLDGVADGADNCGAVPNPGQSDADADTVGDACDNCAEAPNPDQRNTDGGATGDACERRLERVVLDGGGGAAVGAACRMPRASSGQPAAGVAWSGCGVALGCGFVP
jgi:hypothetical protein